MKSRTNSGNSTIGMSQHYRTLLSIGIPIMIGQMGMIVLSFADTMMVGHHSTTELGAASFVNNIINLAIITGTGFSYGLRLKQVRHCAAHCLPTRWQRWL